MIRWGGGGDVVYVDNMRAQYGRMRMCHMLADTTGELLQMADKIGVARKWIQKAGKPEEHFDIAQSKRMQAVKLGAVEITSREAVKVIQRRRKHGKAAGT